jgi:hypothetical protein
MKVPTLYDNSTEAEMDLFTHMIEDHQVPLQDDWTDALLAVEHDAKHRQGPPPDHHAHPPTT